MNRFRPIWPLALALLLAAAVKSVLILSQSVPFNGDEAVVALMARHINAGARPVFFYGQHYMGSLDAWLLALSFRVFGEGIPAIRIAQSGLYLAYIASVWALGRVWFSNPRLADFAALFAAVPPVLVSLYTTATLGGYGESLVLGNFILLVGHALIFRPLGRFTVGGWLGLGVLGGLAFWTLGIAGVYILPVALLGIWRFRLTGWRNYLLAALGFFLGALPWWLYNFTNDWAALLALRGPASHIPAGPLERLLALLLFGLPALFGLRAPWQPGYHVWPLLLGGLLLHGGLGLYLWRRAGRGAAEAGVRPLLAVFVAVNLLALLGFSYGIDPTGRYLLPLFLPLLLGFGALAAALWRQRRAAGMALLLAAWLVHGGATWLHAGSPDRLTTQFDPLSRFDNRHDAALMSFLAVEGIEAGYSNPWVAFRFAFLSGEQLAFAPKLPYKADLNYTSEDNRLPALEARADASPNPAYITTLHPRLEGSLRRRFALVGITYSEMEIGPFHVFYDLSAPITPAELGFRDGPNE